MAVKKWWIKGLLALESQRGSGEGVFGEWDVQTWDYRRAVFVGEDDVWALLLGVG